MGLLSFFKKKEAIPVSLPSELDVRTEVILSGSGGQGMILAGRILAEAASIFEDKVAVMTQSYGPEARGGASKAEVIIGEGNIDYPKVMSADILLCMTQEAMDKYAASLNKDGLLVVDETFVNKIPPGFKNVFGAKISTAAIKVLDTRIVANIIALGCIAAITNIVSREALIKTVLHLVPDKALVIDRIAVDSGFKLVRDSKFQYKPGK
tara:strand:- start:694 stop:1320 length:627 start_codon:yes stop_codon:yes gene_type:complete